MATHRVFLSFLAFGLLSGFVLASKLEDDAVETVIFTYAGSTGPNHWGSLTPQYATCSSGKQQSPIDIVKSPLFYENMFMTALERDYKPGNSALLNFGYNVGLQFEEQVGGLVINGKRYHLKQMHWHTPSEHLFNGMRFPAELHMVHKADDQSMAVVGLLYKDGQPDPLISKLMKPLNDLTKVKTKENEDPKVPLGVFDITPLKEEALKYFRYMGSLTTPPCTENVTWTVLAKLGTISKEQVEALMAPMKPEFKNNSRPVQLSNDRIVEIYRKAPPLN